VNAADITGRARRQYIIDFGPYLSREEAALYEAPFRRLEERVKPFRVNKRRSAYATRWWIHMEARPGLREALSRIERYIATPITAKHRFFVWLPSVIIPSVSVAAIARDDDYAFGLLHSRAHELWARRIGSQLREYESGLRYGPTTSFETFPFPWPTEEERQTVGNAARRLNELREGWLNPLEAPDRGLERRTLTNLYNEMPAWLRDAHGAIDAGVLSAYGYRTDITDDRLLESLFALNQERGATLSTAHRTVTPTGAASSTTG
jgi:type II restriction/modification system DNA methylase subunit YeeA